MLFDFELIFYIFSVQFVKLREHTAPLLVEESGGK